MKIRSHKPLLMAYLALHSWLSLAQSHPVDMILNNAKSASSLSKTEVDASVYSDMGNAQSNLQQKVDQGDRKVEERNANRGRYESNQGQSGTSSGSPSSERRTNGSVSAGSANVNSSRQSTERVRTFWQLKNEMQQIIASCAVSGKEVGYTFHVKTGRYCTSHMSCNTDESWVQRALCN